MGFVPAICTQCGAQLEVDNTQEAAICKYCGTPFIVEKAINQYHTHVINNYAGASINMVGGDIDNLIKLAYTLLEENKFDDAFAYIQKALELCVDNPNIWVARMHIIYKKNSLNYNKSNIQDLMFCGNKMVECYPQTDRSDMYTKLYTSIILEAERNLHEALIGIKDISELKKEAQTMDIAQRTKHLPGKDNSFCRKMNNKVSCSVELKMQIPLEYIHSNQNIQTSVGALCTEYVEYCNAYAERIKIYGYEVTKEGLEYKRDTLMKLKDGLSSELSNALNPENIKKVKAGCYIATCVYGSYDCPEVWTLRRFRDYTLDETWYGRAFIKCYYAISPTLVKLFGQRKWFKVFWKNHLDKMVDSLNKKGISNTKYIDKY